MTILNKIRSMFRREPDETRLIYCADDLTLKARSHGIYNPALYGGGGGFDVMDSYELILRPPESKWTDNPCHKAKHLVALDFRGTEDIARCAFILKHEVTFTLDGNFNIVFTNDDDETLFRVTRP